MAHQAVSSIPAVSSVEKQKILLDVEKAFNHRRRIEIQGIPRSFSKQDIGQILLRNLSVDEIYISRDDRVHIMFKTPQQAALAMRQMEGKQFDGRPLFVCYSQSTFILFVGNIPYDYKLEQFREMMEPFGMIERIFIVHCELTGHSKGYGFVEYLKKPEADRAKREFSQTLNGRKLRIDYANYGIFLNTHIHSTTLFVDKFQSATSSDQLKEMFDSKTPAVFCQIAANPVTKKQRNFAMVDFSTASNAESAWLEFDGAVMNGAKIRISFASPARTGASIIGGMPNNTPQLQNVPVPLTMPKLLDPTADFEVLPAYYGMKQKESEPVAPISTFHRKSRSKGVNPFGPTLPTVENSDNTTSSSKISSVSNPDLWNVVIPEGIERENEIVAARKLALGDEYLASGGDYQFNQGDIHMENQQDVSTTNNKKISRFSDAPNQISNDGNQNPGGDSNTPNTKPAPMTDIVDMQMSWSDWGNIDKANEEKNNFNNSNNYNNKNKMKGFVSGGALNPNNQRQQRPQQQQFQQHNQQQYNQQQHNQPQHNQQQYNQPQHNQQQYNQPQHNQQQYNQPQHNQQQHNQQQQQPGKNMGHQYSSSFVPASANRKPANESQQNKPHVPFAMTSDYGYAHNDFNNPPTQGNYQNNQKQQWNNPGNTQNNPNKSTPHSAPPLMSSDYGYAHTSYNSNTNSQNPQKPSWNNNQATGTNYQPPSKPATPQNAYPQQQNQWNNQSSGGTQNQPKSKSTSSVPFAMASDYGYANNNSFNNSSSGSFQNNTASQNTQQHAPGQQPTWQQSNQGAPSQMISKPVQPPQHNAYSHPVTPAIPQGAAPPQNPAGNLSADAQTAANQYIQYYQQYYASTMANVPGFDMKATMDQVTTYANQYYAQYFSQNTNSATPQTQPPPPPTSAQAQPTQYNQQVPNTMQSNQSWQQGASTYQPTNNYGQPPLPQTPSSYTQPPQQSQTYNHSSNVQPPAAQTANVYSQPPPSAAYGQPPMSQAYGQQTTTQTGSSYGQQTTPQTGSSYNQQTTPQTSVSYGQQTAPTIPGPYGQSPAPAPPSSNSYVQPPVPTSSYGQLPALAGGFGQPAASTESAGSYGQPPVKPLTPSLYGQPTVKPLPPTPYGQPPAPQSNSGSYGQPPLPPSSFGQPVASTSSYGQPSASANSYSQSPASAGSYGQQPSLYGQPSISVPSYGQTPTPQNPSSYGQTPAQTNSTSYGQQPAAPTGSYGQPPNSFGQSSTPQNPYGQKPGSHNSGYDQSSNQPNSYQSQQSGNFSQKQAPFTPKPLKSKRGPIDQKGVVLSQNLAMAF